MQIDWQQFITEHASAIFGLVGTLSGVILTFIATLFLKRSDFSLQMWGKLLERRIAAHENVIKLALEMRIMKILGGSDDNGEIRRAPEVLLSKEVFDEWFTHFTTLNLEGTTWLTTSTKREVNFVQDYLVTLHHHLADIPSDMFVIVGEQIRQDFIDLSSSLEKKAFNFFENDIRKLSLNSLNDWHKYKLPITKARLEKTALLQKREQIVAALDHARKAADS